VATGDLYASSLFLAGCNFRIMNKGWLAGYELFGQLFLVLQHLYDSICDSKNAANTDA
jgi:hypothetical protein